MQFNSQSNGTAKTKNFVASAPGSKVYEMVAAIGGGLNSTGYAMVSDLATNLSAEGFESAIARIRRDGAERSTVALITVSADGKVSGLPESVRKALGLK